MFIVRRKSLVRMVTIGFLVFTPLRLYAQSGQITNDEINAAAGGANSASYTVADPQNPAFSMTMSRVGGSRLNHDVVAPTNIAGGLPNLSRLGGSGHVGGFWMGSNSNGGQSTVGFRYTEDYQLTFNQSVSQIAMTFGAINNNEDGHEEIQNIRVFSDSACSVDITAPAIFGFEAATQGSTTTNPGGTAAGFFPGNTSADCRSGEIGPSAAFGTSPPISPAGLTWTSRAVSRWNGTGNGANGGGQPNSIYGLHGGGSGFGAGCDAGGRLTVTDATNGVQCITFTRSDMVNANTLVDSTNDQASNGITVGNFTYDVPVPPTVVPDSSTCPQSFDLDTYATGAKTITGTLGNGVGFTVTVSHPNNDVRFFAPFAVFNNTSIMTSAGAAPPNNVFDPTIALNDRWNLGITGAANDPRGTFVITFDSPVTNPVLNFTHIDNSQYDFAPTTTSTGGAASLFLLSSGLQTQLVGTVLSDINPLTFNPPGYQRVHNINHLSANGSLMFAGTYSTITANLSINPLQVGTPLDGNSMVIAGGRCFDYGDAPDTYNTASAAGGPSHDLLDQNIYIGGLPDFEGDGQPSMPANGDGADEDSIASFQDYISSGGLTCTGAAGTYTTLANEYCVVVSATNNTASDAQLWAFLDYSLNGIFEDAERSDAINNAAVDDGTFVTGNVPATSGTNDYVLVFQGLPDIVAVDTFVRVRITTDTDVDGANPFSDTSPPVGGRASDGEIEDHPVVAGTLPVTLASFASKPLGSSIRFKWSTSSETFNFGFNLWGEVEGEWHRLNKNVVPSRGADSLVSNSYRKRVSTSDLPGEVTRVGISSVELNGHEEFYGPYEVGSKVGDELIIEPIDWNAVAVEASANLKAQGYVQRGRNFVRERKARRRASASSISGSGFDSNQSLSGNSVLAEFRNESIGMHRVTHDDLMSSGVDLSGLNTADIALLNQGEAQMRFISGSFWNGSSHIDFYNAGVSDELAVHTLESVFRLEYDTSRASVLAAGTIDRTVSNADVTHKANVVRNEQSTYDFIMPKPDPWHERYLYLNANNEGTAGSLHSFVLDANNADTNGDSATVSARIIGLTDFGAGMDHRLELVHQNGSSETVIDEQTADGYGVIHLRGDITAAQLTASSRFAVKQKVIDADPNTGQLPTHWLGSSAFFDSASLTYESTNTATGNIAHWQNDEPSGDGYLLHGFDSGNITAYAHANGSLMQLDTSASQHSGSWTVTIPSTAGGNADYWVSTDSALHTPVIAAPQIDTAALETNSADYVIIAHPNFTDRLTSPGTRQDFVQNKQSHGHEVKVVDYEQVVQVYGYGYRTPDAVTAYLTAESQSNNNLQYVLIVGNASRDANDFSGNGSWDLIPTYYDATQSYLHYAPNDGKLADINADGYQDLAIGRWPVRTEADLNNMIAKTIAYTDGTNATPATQTLNTAVLAADVNDGNDFTAQMESVATQLTTAGFNNTKVYKDNGNTSQDLINAINAGQSITSYSGHAGPGQWSYNGMLHYNQVNQLTNQNHPTLMLPLSCYTTYTVTEHTDTLGQKLMTGDGGAVAMMGASSLSSFHANQSMITDIMQAMTTGVDTDGDNTVDVTLSLGEAVTRAKQGTGADSAINISGNLIGDPSIRIGKQNSTSNMSMQALRAF